MKSQCAITYMNLGPYHIARMRALMKVLPGIHVIEVAGEQKLRPWRPSRNRLGFAVTTLFPDRACEAVSAGEQRGAVRAALSQIDPGVVIVAGYREPVMRAAAKWARDRRRPSILLSPTTYLDHPRTWWKERLKGWLIRRYSFVAATGERAAQYVQQLGFPRDSIFQLGNVIDNAYFTRIGDAACSGTTGQPQLSLPSSYFIAVSRLSPEKNLPRLLEAFAAYRRRGGAWDLVLLGSGPQEQELRTLAQELNVPGIHFLGWKSYEDLPRYYARASCFVLPSLCEPWGLVVNEAMACGLPVLVSRNCGCVPELCRPGENGFIHDPNSAEEMTEQMLRMSSCNGKLSTMGQASRRIIESFTPRTWALRLKECIMAAQKRSA